MIDLTKNEEKVLYGLVKYPDLSDIAIHEKMSVKKSTFAVLKKKLRENGYYSTIRVPILQHIGCTFLIFSYLNLNRKTTLKERLKIIKENSDTFAEEFFTVTEANNAVNISIAKNMTDFERNFAQVIRVYEDNNLLGEDGITTVRYPFELTRCLSFFDYAPVLNRVLGLNIESKESKGSKKLPLKIMDVKNVDLSKFEKKIFHGLIKYPEDSDANIAKKVKCARQSVTKAKERFYEEGRIKKKRYLNLKKLGFEILAVTHSKCNPRKTLEERDAGIEYISDIKTPIFHISKNFDRISITPYKDFEDFHNLHDTSFNFCSKKEVCVGEPKTILLSIPRMTIIKNNIYAPLVEKVLEI